MCDLKKDGLLIDVDGTLYDSFYLDDKKIIENIFGNNVLVKTLDYVLWKINRLDFFSNSMRLLRLRLFAYSILGFKRYNFVLSSYNIEYTKCLAVYLKSINEYLCILSKKYNIFIITNNFFSVPVIESELNQRCIYCSHSKSREMSAYSLEKGCNLKYFIGNNYMDDISVANKLNITSIYVGKSFIKGFFKASYVKENFKQTFEMLKGNR